MSPPDGLWGLPNENGSFNGIIGQLQKREIDLSSVALAATIRRSKAMDYSLPLLTDYMTIMRKVKQLNFNQVLNSNWKWSVFSNWYKPKNLSKCYETLIKLIT